MDFKAIIFDVMQFALYGAITFLFTQFAMHLKSKGQLDNVRRFLEELQMKKEIVEAVVMAIQQIYKHFDGPTKYKAAYERASQLLADRGLDVSAEELHALIESTVKRLKIFFGEQWYDMPVPEDIDEIIIEE